MLALSVQMWEHPPAAVSACVTPCIVGSSWLTRWSRWQWNPGDWMGHFAGTLHATFCSFKITYENGSGPVSLIVKGKHTSFPWEILRLGCNSPPTMDNRRSSKDVGLSDISISKKHLKLKKPKQPLQNELGRWKLVGEDQIQRGEPTHIPAKEISTCCPYSKRTQKGRSGSSTWKLCSRVRRLLFLLCLLQMVCSKGAVLCHCEAKCLPQKHPATHCYTGHSHVLKFFTSIHHSNREIIVWRKHKPPKMWYMMPFILEETPKIFFLHWFFQIIHSVN